MRRIHRRSTLCPVEQARCGGHWNNEHRPTRSPSGAKLPGALTAPLREAHESWRIRDVGAQDGLVTAGVHLLVPIKPLRLAKSRLLGAADDGAGDSRLHADLVTAVALDTVIAARLAPAVEAVLVVTSDPELTSAFVADGVEVLPDEPDNGLNAALRHGEAFLRRRNPAARIGALQADLPALSSEELGAAVRAAGGNRAFCADRQGTGTTLLLARPGDPLDPRFGPDSAAAHAASNATPLAGRWESLRCDVDVEQDLRVARRLGLGRRTTAQLALTANVAADAP